MINSGMVYLNDMLQDHHSLDITPIDLQMMVSEIALNKRFDSMEERAKFLQAGTFVTLTMIEEKLDYKHYLLLLEEVGAILDHFAEEQRLMTQIEYRWQLIDHETGVITWSDDALKLIHQISTVVLEEEEELFEVED